MIRSVLIAALIAAPAIADEPTTLEGRVGCTLSWDYPAEQEQFVAAFPIWVDGQWRKGVRAALRSATCDEIGMGSPGTYRLELFARANADSGYSNSPRVAFIVNLSAPERNAATPSNIRLTVP